MYLYNSLQMSLVAVGNELPVVCRLANKKPGARNVSRERDSKQKAKRASARVLINIRQLLHKRALDLFLLPCPTPPCAPSASSPTASSTRRGILFHVAPTG